MEGSPKTPRAKPAAPQRAPEHGAIVTPARLPGQAPSPSLESHTPAADARKSVMFPPRPQAPPPHPPQSSAPAGSASPSLTPSTVDPAQPKLPPKNVPKFPPRPNGPAPTPPTSSPPSSPAQTHSAPQQPPTLQPKQPKQHVTPGSANASSPVITPNHPPTGIVTPTHLPGSKPAATPSTTPTTGPVATPTSPPLVTPPHPKSVLTPAHPPVVTPNHPPVTTPAHPPVVTPNHPPVTTPVHPPTATPVTTPASPPTAPVSTPPNPAGNPTSPTVGGGIQARIQAMSTAPGKDRPQAKAPAGAVPLPTMGAPQPAPGNPKVPAKPTNLNGRLVNQRASQMVPSGLPPSDYEYPDREKFQSSRSKLAGFYPIPLDGGEDNSNSNNHTGIAPSHVVPPPKPLKPKFVDLQLTSAQIASAQISSSTVTGQLTTKEPSQGSSLSINKVPVQQSGAAVTPANIASAAGSKFFDNKTMKKPAAINVRESVSDIIVTESKKIDDEKVFYSDMLERIGKQTLAHTKSVDTSQFLAQLIRDHGSRSVFAAEDPMFGKCLMQAGEVLRFTEVLRSQITLMWTNIVMAKANEFVSNDIDETLAIKTRVESLKSSLDATNAKLKSMTTKGKVNLVKLSDLRRERDALIIKYKEEKARTLPTLMSTNHKHATDFMGTMCDVLSEYHTFFDQGQKILANITTDVADYRVHIAKKKEEFARKQEDAEAAQKDDEDDDIFPKDEATFSDVLSKALVESESQYHAQLDSLVKTYLQSIWSDGTLFSEIVKEDVTAIFGNIEVLADVQHKLQETLFQDSSNLSTESISRSFANFTNAMSDVYMQYISNYNKAQDTLEQCKKKSKIFCNMLKNCEARDVQTDRADLSLLLSVPLERLKQYEAYFSEISKKEQNEIIKANITQVLECLSGLAAAADDANNQAKIKSILEVVNLNPDPNATDSLSAGVAGVMGVISGEKQTLSPEETARWYAKKFIREGPMNLVETNAEKRAIKEYYFFLFNDVLVGVKRAGLPRAMGGSALAFLKGKVHAKYLWEINKAVLSDMPDEEGMRHCISLTINGLTYILSAETEDSKQFWIFAITKAKEQIEKRKIFGVPLEELMNQATEVGRDVPSFFEKSLEFILANAIEEEGIFRLSGSANDIAKMQQKADQGLELTFYGIPYHNVSGIFKLFIRSMPVPVVNFELYNAFLAATKTDSKQEKLRLTKAAVQQMPKYHKYMLQYLMKGLAQITQHVGKNKMTPYNLSIVFGPHVLKKRESDPVSELNDSKTIYDVIQLMIEEHDAIFAEVAAEREVVRKQRAQQQLELAQKNRPSASKQYKYEPSVSNITAPEDDDDEDEENDAKLQGITISLKEIVKQGFLQKKGANRRNWTSRWFVLKHKYLFYFKNQKDQTPKGMISLVGVKVSASDRKPYCFAISSANREYLICGKSQTEADEWMAAIKTCTTD